jgi:hypothetical protein
MPRRPVASVRTARPRADHGPGHADGQDGVLRVAAGPGLHLRLNMNRRMS